MLNARFGTAMSALCYSKLSRMIWLPIYSLDQFQMWKCCELEHIDVRDIGKFQSKSRQKSSCSACDVISNLDLLLRQNCYRLDICFNCSDQNEFNSPTFISRPIETKAFTEDGIPYSKLSHVHKLNEIKHQLVGQQRSFRAKDEPVDE